MPAIRCGEALLHYEVYGEAAAPAIVFAHGSGGNTLSWWQQVPHFARERRVVLFDHRGFGRSTCPEAAFSPAAFPGDLLAILDHAGIERAALVCQSMGGLTGLPFAVAHPERTAALVLCGTWGGLVTEAVTQDFARVAAKRGQTTLRGMTLAASFPEREPERTHLYEQIQQRNPPIALELAMRGAAGVRVREEDLADFRTPTLLVVGTEDAFFSPATIADVAKRIPDSRVVTLPGVGHSAYFEVPETFNRIVDEFLGEQARP